ncbi:hypothetical protein BaRGS_00003963 [Batillaria attramentaria]|uniref:Uncharacterized protein n=1 Tax=Batillaria attramentaria TaxID=370345 RepID=A0ABD0LZA6_9CAEN
MWVWTERLPPKLTIVSQSQPSLLGSRFLPVCVGWDTPAPARHSLVYFSKTATGASEPLRDLGVQVSVEPNGVCCVFVKGGWRIPLKTQGLSPARTRSCVDRQALFAVEQSVSGIGLG